MLVNVFLHKMATDKTYDYDCNLQLHAGMQKICAPIIGDHASVFNNYTMHELKSYMSW